MDTTTLITAWLMLLTVGMAANTVLLLVSRRELKGNRTTMEKMLHKLEAVDLKEDILELRDLLSQSAIRRSADVQRKVSALLERLKADPLLYDRYWTEAQALENLLK
jgi:hypothetical protein